MERVNPTHPLGMTAVDYLTGRFVAALTKPLDMTYVSTSVDALASELVVTSLAYSASNEVGMYRGEFRSPYVKGDLAKALPMPVLYQGPWPTRFDMFAGWMYNRYGIVLEDGEFEMDGVVLEGIVQMTGTPGVNDVFDITATAQSGRWLEGTRFLLRVVTIGVSASVPSLFTQTDAGDMLNLVKA